MKTLRNPLLSFFLLSAFLFLKVNSRRDCATIKKLSTSKLICYYSTIDNIDGCHCTHVILPPNADVKSIDRIRGRAKGVKVYVSVNEFNQGLINLLKSNKVDGLEIKLKKLDSKNDISDFISTVKSKIGTDLDIALSVPANSELVAKYFDFKALAKHADLFILETAFLGASSNVTFHPSRLSGMWDMQNTDSVVDLINGLGAPLSKVIIAAPVQAFEFTLQSEEYTAPGSPAVELKSITRDELCKAIQGGKNWTLERDEDQAGTYVYRKNQWIAFEDLKSIDIKAKYSRVRGLAGIALKDLAQDGGAQCGSTILEATFNGLSRQARAPRGAVLHSLEREILESPTSPLDYVQVSPYTISRIIDTEGKIHIARQDTRTEFQCSRQGYFVHPRSCNRFYRCVKFDQLSNEFNVFEFDCPAGLAFDERVEVCVWPGSLPHGTPCSGSSEIAPVPRSRFECPSEPGYYADPENCRWFFACLDHGKSPLEAYEFRCPFGLGFDGERLVCEWPWLVPKCSNLHDTGLASEYYYGGASGNNGYLTKGAVSLVLGLQNYDGLGALGAVKLGGISGTIEKPIATVYSNIGGALGLGYQNNRGHIEGGGLSYKAAQALANAGLLKVNNGAGYQNVGHQQGTIYTTSDFGSGNANVQYLSGIQKADGQQLASGFTVGSGQQGTAQYIGQHGTGGGAFLINANGNYDSDAKVYIAGQLDASGNAQYHGAIGQYQDSNLRLVQGSVDGAGYATTGTGTYGYGLQDISQDHGTRQSSGLHTVTSGTLARNHQDASEGYQNGYIQVAGEDKQTGSNEYQSEGVGIYSGFVNNGYGATGKDIQVTGYTDGAVTSLGKEADGYVVLGGNSDQENRAYVNSGAYISGKNDFPSQFVNVVSQDQLISQGIAGGAISAQGFAQYHDQEGTIENYDSGVKGNINIIGGGYSAVGSLGGVQVSNNGEVDDVKTVSFSSTPSPFSVTTYAPISTVASVPTVTAVPVPGIKTAAGFETFKGGVIANIPALQYKVKPHVDAGLLANISSSFANFVVTTPLPVTKAIVQQTYSQDGGYIYEKPEKEFEEGRLNTITVSTARPFASVSTEEPKTYVSSTIKPIFSQGVPIQQIPVVYTTSKPVVSTITYQKYDINGGYKYEKPSVLFEEKPQGVVVDNYSHVSTPKPAVYVQQQPQIYVSSTPATLAESSYSLTQEVNQKQDGYDYDKPAVSFAEGPTNPIIISKFSIKRPNVHSAINTVKFVQQQPALLNEIPTVQVQQKNVVENYAYQQPAQVISQFYYQQPVIKQPIIPLFKQPELLSTYTYQPPIQKTVYTQPVSTYTYQNIAQESAGLVYAKPQITLVQQPIQTSSSYQFNEDTSYQTTKLENSVQEKSNTGYEYPEPSTAFEEKPQLAVVSAYQYSTPRPNVFIQEAKSQGAYVYEKPIVQFEETPVTYSTPKPAVSVQPAVVTSFFNIDSSKSEHVSAEQGNVDGNYVQSVVELKKTPVTYARPKPFTVVQPVTPAVVTSYFNIQSSTSKPNVFVQEPIVYSTPKPIVAQPDVIVQQKVGYIYPKPEIKFEENPVKPAVVSSYNYIGSTTPQPNIVVKEQHPVNYIPKPQIEYEPAVVTSYFHQQPSKTIISKGYNYPKPAVQFEESPVQPAVEPSYNYLSSTTPQPNIVVGEEYPISYIPKPQITVEHKPAVVTSYFHQHPSKTIISKGYDYPKPAVQFEESPVQPAIVPSYNYIGSTTPQPNIVVEEEHPISYIPKPQITVEHKPAVVTSYFHQQPSKTIISKGYDYPKPAVQFEESPVQPAVESGYNYVSSTTPQPNIVVEEAHPISYIPNPQITVEHKPAVVTSYFHQQPSNSIISKGYDYPKPSVQFEENRVQPAIVPSYNYIGSTTPQPKIVVEEEHPISYIPKTQITVEHKPAVVTGYFHQQPSKSIISKGYDYPKPAVQFEEEPLSVISSYDNIQPVQELPFVKKTAYVTGQYHQSNQANYNYRQDNYQQAGKVAVENYIHPNYEKIKQALIEKEVYQQQPQVVLNYVSSTPKPSFVSTIKTIVQPTTPATVTFYDSRYTATPVPSVVAPEIKFVSSTTSRPILRYSFSSLDDQYQHNQNVGAVKSTTPEAISYDFISTTPQPNIILEKQPITYTTKTKAIVEQKPAVVSSYFYQQPGASEGYHYPKPSVQFAEEPQPVITSYNNVEPVQEVPFVKKTAYVTSDYQQTAQGNYNYQQNLQENYQQKNGVVAVENYVHPNYEKVKQAIFEQQTEIQYQQPQVVLNYVQSTPKPTLFSTVKAIATKRLQPISVPETVAYGSKYFTTPSYVTSSDAPEVNIVSTTSRPISKYSFSSLDDESLYNQNLEIVKTTLKPPRVYLPVTSRIKVTTALPKVTTHKVLDGFVVPEVTTLSRDYLPVRIRTKAPATEYLPVEVTTPLNVYLPSRQKVAVGTSTIPPEVTTLFREYLPAKSRIRVTTTETPLEVLRPITVIKQNDAHPLLPAKLGAQCTCVSNTLRLRKKQKVIIVDDDQDEDDDGYIVDNGSQDNIVENYSYEPQKVVDITPTPQGYLPSVPIVSQTYIKKRVKVRPVLKQSYLPVSEVSDIFYKKDTDLEDPSPSDREVLKAVRTGLKLVKQAAKEGAREGTQDALSGAQFDRYGPGGVRSRSETLQGTIDCQRAGLFRHPTECNKFYACRWDCTKNRFTLHVFNCPVHLTFDNTLGACNWPSQGPACVENTLITSD